MNITEENNLEQLVRDVRRVEEDLWWLPLADDPSIMRCNEKNIQELEQESTTLKEQNKKLTAELRDLQAERERDKVCLSKFNVAVHKLEFGMEEAQLELQHRDEIIQQRDMQLKQAEEAEEECSNIIKDLRLTNQELRNQLEDRQDEASFAMLNDIIREKEELNIPPLSFAEEIKLLASTQSVSTDPRQEETAAEEPLQLQGLSVNLQTSRLPRSCTIALRELPQPRCTRTMENAIQKVGGTFLYIFILTVLAFVALEVCAGYSYLFSINPLSSGTHLMLEPYFRFHHRAQPPI